MQTRSQQHKSSHSNMLHEGHCRGDVASAQSSKAVLGRVSFELRDLVSGSLSGLFTPAQRSWRWRTSCFIMKRLRRHASAALRVLAEESSPSGAPKPDSVDRKRRLLARPQIWKGGGRISARYLTERTRSSKPHGSILSSTRVGGNMD